MKKRKVYLKNQISKEEIKKIIISNKEILQKYKVKSIALFGSYVRNEQRKNSDIDLLVEFKETSFDNYIGLLFAFKRVFKRKIELLTKNMISPYIQPYILKEVEYIERY